MIGYVVKASSMRTMKLIYKRLLRELKRGFYDFWYPHDHEPPTSDASAYTWVKNSSLSRYAPVSFTQQFAAVGRKIDYYQPVSYCTKCHREITYYSSLRRWEIYKDGNIRHLPDTTLNL